MKAVAFKVTYNDGGAGAGLVGYRGVCSDRAILENVLTRKMTNCSDRRVPCRTFADGNFTGRRPSLSANAAPWCYEAALFSRKPFRFGSGYFHHGEKKGMPIPMNGVEPGDIAFLTTLLPGGAQTDRFVFGCFRVGPKVFLEEGWGYMAESDGTMDIRIPDDVARKLNFWRYFKNKDGSRFWGTGLFRYLQSETTEALLTDLINLLGDREERDILLTALPPGFRKPVRQPPDGGGSFGGGCGGGGESEAHRKLKEYVAAHPEKIGLPKSAVASIEFPYLSGDQVDIKFDVPGGKAAVVEIETIDTLPGAHQCIKYRALLEAASGHPINSGHVEAILVAHKFDGATRTFATNYNIRLVQMVV
ncbi:hypothetical protein [Aromatoleum evansii]|uniref:hypothetical protein n=1 Tax=Aromatoleum evansii TaxID=59406 RepID=UPI00145DCCB9|nr:hypothetical protein [Aromatoleum evansii]NMG31964.1 hypothetical protein [Aromatoleum evansii]